MLVRTRLGALIVILLQFRSLIDNLVIGAVVPDIKIIDTSRLQAKGAFGDGTIYLSLVLPDLVDSLTGLLQ
jgi:hypothetical protein